MTIAADRPRVVFDCNVLVQAVGNGRGSAAEALRLLERGIVDVYLSRAVLKELRAVLRYPTVREQIPDLNDHAADKFVNRLVFGGVVLRRVRHRFDYPRAHQDEPYLDLAAGASEFPGFP